LGENEKNALDQDGAFTRIEYGDKSYNLQKNIGLGERLAFIDATVEFAFIDKIAPSELALDAGFAINFMRFFTDIELAYKESEGEKIIDVEKTLKIANEYGLTDRYDMARRIHAQNGEFFSCLRDYVTEQAEYEFRKRLALAALDTPSNRAIEKFAGAMGAVEGLVENLSGKLNGWADKLEGLANHEEIQGILSSLKQLAKDEG
jgi:hypothetical protein